MKRFRRIYALLGVLAAVCIVTVVVMKTEEKKEAIQNSNEVVLSIDSSTVTSLAWSYDVSEDTASPDNSSDADTTEDSSEEKATSASLAFHKDAAWLYDEDEAFPVSASKIESLLNVFSSFEAAFEIDDVDDYSQYGLDNPVCTINVEADGESYEIKLGSYSSMDSERYVSIGDGKVYLAASDPLDSYQVVLSDLIQQDEIPDFSGSSSSGSLDLTGSSDDTDDADSTDSASGTKTVTSVDAVAFTGSSAEHWELEQDEDNDATYREDDVYFTEVSGSAAPLDSSLVESYLSTVSGLSLTDYVTYNATEEELESYGLDDPELTVTVAYTTEDADGEESSESFVLHVSRDPAEAAAAEEADTADTADTAEEETVTAYVRVGDSPIVYQITGTEYQSLMAASYDDLRHAEVLPADFADVAEIEVTLEDETYVLTSEASDADDAVDGRVWSYQDAEIDISSLKSALESLTAGTFTDESASDVEEISLTVRLDRDDSPEISIELYRYDGENCLAVVDGTPVCLTARSSVVSLMEAVRAIVL